MATRTETALRALGLRVQELRRAQEETQESFADRIRMLAPNFARIEQGRMNVTVDTLVRVANGLGVELAELFVPPKAKKGRPGRPRKDR